MKKRIASVFLAILLTVTMLTIPAQAHSIDELTIKSGLDYASVGFISDGYCVVRKDTDGDGYDEYGLIDSKGNEIVPPKYDYMAKPVEGMARVGMDTDGSVKTGWKFNTVGIDKFGFVDMTGKETVPLIYDDAEDFSEGLAAVSTTSQRDLDDWGIVKITVHNTGFVDKTGKVVIPLIYDNVNGIHVVSNFGPLGDGYSTKKGFSEGLASVRNKDGKWGVIDKQGNTVIPFTYDSMIGGFSGGLASVYLNGKCGYIDKQGKMVIPALYNEANDFKEGFAVVGTSDATSTTDYRRGVIDRQGNVVIPLTYEALGVAFSDGMLKAAVPSLDSSGKWVGWKWGFLNTKGELVVPTMYYSVNTFSEGLAVVNLPDGWTGTSSTGGKDRYAVIDKQGTVVIPLQSENISDFSEELAAVGSPLFPKYHYIDKTGAIVISKTANHYGTSKFSGGIAIAYDKNSGKYSIMKNPLSTGQTPTPPDDGSPTFTDVPAGEWYADPVAWAVDKGITNGTSSTKFSPTQDCTQAQILTFLYRAARGEGKAASEDMDKAISWAREKGMIDNSFDGNKPCTRSTAVSYIWQAFSKPTAKASSFTDVPANAAYAKAVDWAVEKGITKGDGSETTFAPDKVCTRGHIVTFLYRAYNN